MKSCDTNKLINNIINKGISFRRGEKEFFRKHDYFQIINAYKGLFVSGVEKIDDIINNINMNDSESILRYRKNFQLNKSDSLADMKNKILNKLVSKYDLSSNVNRLSEQDKMDLLNKIKYVHHIYKDNTFYGDFVRMYHFEHELRSILLRYTLSIEENIKRIFITYLNDKEVNDNYLLDIKNYNLSKDNSKRSLESLNKLLGIYKNDKSRPVLRKMNQSLLAPYWIVINEMSLNQTITTINNLLPEDKYKIYQKCVEDFTNTKIDIYDRSKTSQIIDKEKKHLENFINILKYVGEFRNLLAHNQPIYNYNIKDIDLITYPTVSYKFPSKDNVLDQYRINAASMYSLIYFYGIDFFNSRNYQVNIDLSWMIYVIGKIINKLFNDSSYAEDIRSVYKKYNILLGYNDVDVSGLKELADLQKLIREFDDSKINASEIIELIESGKSYKQKIKKDYAELKNKIKSIKLIYSKINIKRKKSKYKPFMYGVSYKKYTNIDVNFLMNL